MEWTTPTLLNKIRGAWAGKIAGVIAGTPAEFRACGRTYAGPLGWDLPTTVALLQDDLYVNMAFLEVLDEKGPEATQAEFAEAIRNSGFALFHANLAARRNLLMGVPPPLSGRPPHNLHADDIDFQIEADFIGLVSPALPRAASDLAFRVGPIINYGDGVYGGVFVANLYALAFVESDPAALVRKALESIPAESAYRRCIETALGEHEKHPSDWKAAWQAVQERWDGVDRCPGGVGSPFNIDAKLNGAYVVIALLYGNGDPERTVEIGVRCGQDADCNPSTAMGVLGTILGYDRLPADWRRAVDSIDGLQFSYVPYTFTTVSETCLDLALNRIRNAGGSMENGSARVEPQLPASPGTLEQWDDGLVAVALVPYGTKDWSWEGRWIDGRVRGGQARFAQNPPASATVAFEGSGVMLLGCLAEAGGRLELRLDDREPEVIETYLFARGRMLPIYIQEALYYSGPIPKGTHTLRLRVLDEKYAESLGRIVGIQGIVVYESEP